ncbi:hypothetical protein IT570_08970 [Candidatus Sumerlaeota bacterium]|nr:hypothetical protein [Candidatus Sumerlaeota bacterium]
MARKSPRSVPTTIPEARPAEKPRHGVVPFFARMLVALAVVSLVLASWSFYRDYLTASVIARNGYAKASSENGLVIGLAEIRTAHKLNPADPNIQLTLANTILKQETQKVRAQDFHAVDFSNLNQCLALLRRAQKSNLKPHFVQLKFAEAANLAVRYLQMTGQRAQSEPFAQEAIANFVAFREQQGVARDKAEAIYGLAIDLASIDPSIALKFWDDYARAFGDDSFRNKDVMMKVLRSYRWMGEFHILSARAANLTLDAPDDGDYMNVLEELGTRLGQKQVILLLTNELERQNKLTARGRVLRSRLTAG